MKALRYLCSLLIACVIFSCSENPIPAEPVTVMTIELKETFMENSTDKWVFATNEKGEVLDIVQLLPGTPKVELQTTTPFSSIDFTIFSFYDLSTDNFTLETFKDFPKNELVVLGDTPSIPTFPAGTANITVTNYKETLDPKFNVSFSTSRFGTNSLSNPVLSGSNYSVNLTLGAANETVHVYGLRAGIPVYNMLKGVVPNESRSVDYSTFEPFQNFVPFNFLGYAYTSGVNEDKSDLVLVASSKQSSEDPGQVYTATVPGFSKYITYIVSYSGFYYWKVGAPIKSLTPPVYTTTILNNTIENFNASISDAHDYKLAEFRKDAGSERISWIVNAPSTVAMGIKFDFPSELKTAYPSLTISGLQYSNSSFFRSSGTYTYNDMLAYRFKKVLKNEFELFTFYSN